jgi:hypothetical protein
MQMTWCVAVPSYRRASVLRAKTLALLAKYRVPAERITVFVVPEDAATYEATLDPGSYGCLRRDAPVGMAAVRNYITGYYPIGTHVFCLDDDVSGFVQYDPTARWGASPLEDLMGFVDRAFEETRAHDFCLWGVYPCDNGFFMRDRYTTDLRYAVGCAFGLINPGLGALTITLDDKEDFQRSVLCYLLCGGMLRYSSVAVYANFWTTPGGMQTTRTSERILQSAHAMVTAYPGLARIRQKRSGAIDVALLDKRRKRTFGVGAIREFTAPVV